MPLSSTHRITRALASRTGKGLAALSIAAVALAGCSGGNGADSQPDAQGQGQQQGGSDGGGQSLGDQNGQGQDGQDQGKPDTSDIPDPVATVNGEKVTKDEFVSTYESQYQQAQMQQQQTGQKVDDGDLKKQVAEQLVGNHLLLQAADKAGIKASDKDVDKTLDELAQQNGLGSADELVKALKQQGTDEDEVRQNAASQYELNTYIDKKAKISEPGEKELKKQYKQLKAQQEQQQQTQKGQGGDQQGQQQQKVPPFEQVKGQLADQAMSQQRNDAATKIVKDLQKDADVKVKL